MCFFFNDAATPEIYTLSLHDALPFSNGAEGRPPKRMFEFTGGGVGVLDYDLDGFADTYMTQGRPWPPDSPAGGHGDRLFRKDRKSTRLNSSHANISYAVFCLKKKTHA